MKKILFLAVLMSCQMHEMQEENTPYIYGKWESGTVNLELEKEGTFFMTRPGEFIWGTYTESPDSIHFLNFSGFIMHCSIDKLTFDSLVLSERDLEDRYGRQ
jgi:hypothetical protein